MPRVMSRGQAQRAITVVELSQFGLGVAESVGTHRVVVQRGTSHRDREPSPEDRGPAHPAEPVDPLLPVPALGEFTGCAPRIRRPA